MLARFLGTAVHKYIEGFSAGNLRQRIPRRPRTGRDRRVVYKNGRIVDYKTTRWLKIDKLPYGSHVQQLNIYAALLRSTGPGSTIAAIQYIDMSGPSKMLQVQGTRGSR